MKTHTIKTPTAELLVVELLEEHEIIPHDNGIIVIKDSVIQWEIKGSYTLLGKPDEISEEDARELVERIGDGDPCYQGDWFVNYQDDEYMFETATESLLSAVESVILWENPYYRVLALEFPSAFKNVESRTFDRTRTLIFVKN